MNDDELAQAVDEAGAGYEAKGADLERWAERLREESGEDWAVNHLPVEVPAGVRGEVVGTWPGGEPMVVFSYFEPGGAED